MIEIHLPKKNFLSPQEIKEATEKIDAFTVNLKVKNDFRELLFIAKKFHKIVVVGNQRSGTTFAAQLLANELFYTYIDESEFEVNNEKLFREKLLYNTVAQAPSLTDKVHRLVSAETLVIFMVRKWSDIISSIYKKNGHLSDHIFMNIIYDYKQLYWSINEPRSVKYFHLHVSKKSYFLNEVYAMWKFYQSNLIPNTINFQYESLKDTKYWIDKKNRGNFNSKTTGIYS